MSIVRYAVAIRVQLGQSARDAQNFDDTPVIGCDPKTLLPIMEAIDREPTVLAPRLRLGASAGRVAFAAAASVATVAVVGWIGLQERGTSAGPAMARSDKGAPAAPTVAAAAATVVPLTNVNHYVVVHRQVPNAEFYRPVANQAAGGR